MNWYIRRDLWRNKAIEIRAEFERNRWVDRRSRRELKSYTLSVFPGASRILEHWRPSLKRQKRSLPVHSIRTRTDVSHDWQRGQGIQERYADFGFRMIFSTSLPRWYQMVRYILQTGSRRQRMIADDPFLSRRERNIPVSFHSARVYLGHPSSHTLSFTFQPPIFSAEEKAAALAAHH